MTVISANFDGHIAFIVKNTRNIIVKKITLRKCFIAITSVNQTLKKNYDNYTEMHLLSL